MNVRQFWADVLRQDAAAIRTYFAPGAWINWHNTNEHFTVEEFIRANCEYPGDWDGEIEQLLCAGEYTITAVHVYSKEDALHFHVASFIRVLDGKIVSIDEYWGDDGPAPQWRQEMRIGRKIKEDSRRKAIPAKESAFSFEERKAYFKKKWRKEHLALFVILAIILTAAIVLPLVPSQDLASGLRAAGRVCGIRIPE